jgi:HK97 family phage prohead protease
MPLPLPEDGEPHDAFLSRCMGDEAMMTEFPDQDQRAAVCERQWQAEDKLCRLDLELKASATDEAGTFEGVASMFGEVDMLGDTVAPGAFKKSLAEHKRAGRMPLLLWAHDLSAPIGRWLDIRETAHGLAVKGRLILDTVRGREAYALLKERALDGLSIGFRTVQSVRTKTGRLLKEIDLAEISLVTLPALASARVHSVKSQPRREAVHPADGSTANDTRIVRSGRRAGPVRISRRSIAARAYPNGRNQGR